MFPDGESYFHCLIVSRNQEIGRDLIPVKCSAGPKRDMKHDEKALQCKENKAPVAPNGVSTQVIQPAQPATTEKPKVRMHKIFSVISYIFRFIISKRKDHSLIMKMIWYK